MTSVSIHKAKAGLSMLVARVQATNESVMICRYGKAVAELVPVRRDKRTGVDRILSKVKIRADLTEPTQKEWENV